MEDGERRVQLLHSWDVNADAWTEAVREQRIESRRLVTDRAIEQVILATTPRRVLDVGCGEGWLARALFRHGIEVVGVDSSAGLIDRARELGGGHFHVLRYDDLTARSAEIGDHFDAVVCNFSLLDERIVDLLAALRTRLAPGGSLLVQTVHPLAGSDDAYQDGWRTEHFAAFGGGFGAAMPWYFRTFSSWIADLTAAGYCVVGCEEPRHPVSDRPLSLLWSCRAADC